MVVHHVVGDEKPRRSADTRKPFVHKFLIGECHRIPRNTEDWPKVAGKPAKGGPAESALRGWHARLATKLRLQGHARFGSQMEQTIAQGGRLAPWFSGDGPPARGPGRRPGFAAVQQPVEIS
jgi:hypothetical protein